MISREQIEALLRELSPSISIGTTKPKAKDGIRDNSLFVDISASPPRLFIWNKNKWDRVGVEAGDFSIDVTAPLTKSGSLESNLTLGLAYNPSHFGVTNGELVLANPISTQPVFDTVRLLNLDDGYVPFHANDNAGLVNSPIFTNGVKVGIGTTTFSELFTVNGNAEFTGNVIVGQQATQSNHAVIGSRVIGTSPPLTNGGDLTADRNIGLNYNTTNLKLTSNALNTIQDIAATSTPTFNQVTLGSQATLTTHSVRADRTINTSAPLINGGNLTADRTIGLSYNTTNLKLTSNALNTIQDIATTSTPTFTNIILSALSNNYIPYKISSGLVDSSLYYNAGNIGIGTTNPTYKLDVNGNAHFTQNVVIDTQATQPNHAVTGSRAINTSAPLINGGNLTADRIIGLSYNTTNFKLTSNALNTIQDIATTSSPTFSNLTLTNSLRAKSISRAYISQNVWENNTFGSQCGIGLGLNRLLNASGGRYTITTTNITGNIAYLFDGMYNQFVSIPANQTGIIEIDFNPQLQWTANTYTGYPHLPSVFVVTSFNTPIADIKLEVYRKNTATGLDEWSEVFHTTTNTENPYITFIPGMYYYIKKLRLTVVNPSSTNVLKLTEIEWFPVREGSLEKDTSFISIPRLFTLFPMNVQFNPLRFRDNAWNKVIDIEQAGNILFFNGTKKIGSGDNNPFQIVQNNSAVIHIDTAKNVGINTTNPTYKLDINGSGRYVNDLTLDTILNQQGTSGTNIFKADINQQGDKSIYNNFTSGWTGTGWRVDYGVTNTNRASLELDDLTVRGTMRVYELIINQIRATNGSLFVSSSAKAESVVRIAGDPVQYTITFEDPEGHNICPFLINDIVIVQRVRLDSLTVVKRIVLQVTSVNNRTITGSVLDESGQIERGDLVVRIGNATNTARQGSVYLTSDDTNSPYIDVIDGVNSLPTWNSTDKIKIRLGKLTGINDTFFGTLSGYGLYAKSNAYLRGKIYAEQGGWIAGWDINSNDLSSPLIANNHQLKLVADNTNNIIGAYLDININGANPLYLSFGRIKINGTTYGSNYGLSFKSESGNDYFELSNNVRHIAGWNFDATKFYNGTDIELNSYTKSIGVNSNKVKMFYTDSNNWGIVGLNPNSDTVFELGSVNRIAGWNFDNQYLWKLGSGTPSSSPSRGLVLNSASGSIGVYGDHWKKAVYMFYTDDNNWGIKGYKNDGSLDLVFELGSNNQISGWNFDEQKLYKDTDIELNATNKSIGVNANKVKLHYTSSSDWGILGKDSNNNTVFQLGSTNQIAGWNFDNTKFSKNNTRLENSSSFSGLAVSKLIGSNTVDVVKVGEYTLGAPSTYLTQFTFTATYGTYGWGKTYIINTDGAFPENNNPVFTTTQGTIAGFSFLKTNDNSLKNKYIRLKTTITMPSPVPYSWIPKCIIEIKVNNVVIGGTTYDSGAYPNVGGWTFYYDETILYLGGSIQISVYLINDTGAANSFVPVTININNRDIINNDTITEISHNGFRIYDSGGRRGIFYNTTDGLKIKGALNLSDDWIIIPNAIDETVDWYYKGTKVARITSSGAWQTL